MNAKLWLRSFMGTYLGYVRLCNKWYGDWM